MIDLIVLCCTSDAPSTELDQLELPVLCDGLRRYLQDLPFPVISPAVYPQMVHTAKGETPFLQQCGFCSAGTQLNTKCFTQKPKDVINVL